MMHGKILLESVDDVSIMTLHDPAVLNAFGHKLREDMQAALDQIEAGSARCLVITGTGRAFCSGANLNDPDRPPRDRAAEARGELKAISRHGTIQRLCVCGHCRSLSSQRSMVSPRAPA